MTEVGAYEAKTNLPKLLDRVAKGERITITKHGVAVAVLSPASGKRATVDVLADLRDFRKGRSLGGLSIRDMIEEGRR